MKNKFDEYLSTFGKINPIKAMIILFAFLAIFILIVEQPGTFESKQKKGERFFVPQLKVEEIISIDIYGLSNGIVNFKKINNIWNLNDEDSTLLNSELIEEFLGKIYTLKEELIVSNNSEKQSLYAVDDQFGLRIVLKDEYRDIVDFYTGKITGLDSQYIRKTKSDDVLQVTPILLNLSEFSVDDFINN